MGIAAESGKAVMQKTVLLIGENGGMGQASKALLTDAGFRVIGLDRSNAEILCDVTDPEAIERAFETVEALHIRLDAIAYMAGIYDTDSLIEIDETRLRRIFEVNFFGAARIIRTFYPLLKENGRVVIVTSELAPLDPLPFTGLYGVTKTTLERYAFSLAMELQLIGQTVSVIRPGAVATPLIDRSVERIESFTANTTHYPNQAERFLKVTRSVESKSVPPEVVAKKLKQALTAKHPKFLYNLNRNPLLLLYGLLPKGLKLFAIKTYLK